MKITEFRAEMQKRGWTLDSYGHLKKEVVNVNQRTGERESRVLRCKVQKTSVRVERQVIYAATQYSKEQKDWIRTGGAYLKDIRIDEDDCVVVGKYRFKYTEV